MTGRLFPIVLLVIAALGAALLAAPQMPQNVILISWDGAQRDHFNDQREVGRLPNLTALAKDGTLVDISKLNPPLPGKPLTEKPEALAR